MNWILIFYLSTPLNYQVHSDYQSKEDCQNRAVYYNEVFNTVDTKLVAVCKPKEFKQYAKNQNKLVYKTYTVR
jgi:hypothetical protein